MSIIYLFYYFAFLMVIAATLVISSTNPIHSILALIVVFCNATALLLLLEVEYLAMTFLVIYVGAIAVLFLFIIMMLNLKLLDLYENLLRYTPIGSLLGLIFLIELILVIDNDILQLFNIKTFIIIWPLLLSYMHTLEVIGFVLYTYEFYILILASILLLIALVGTITLTLYKDINIKHQLLHAQVFRFLIKLSNINSQKNK